MSQIIRPAPAQKCPNSSPLALKLKRRAIIGPSLRDEPAEARSLGNSLRNCDARSCRAACRESWTERRPPGQNTPSPHPRWIRTPETRPPRPVSGDRACRWHRKVPAAGPVWRAFRCCVGYGSRAFGPALSGLGVIDVCILLLELASNKRDLETPGTRRHPCPPCCRFTDGGGFERSARRRWLNSLGAFISFGGSGATRFLPKARRILTSVFSFGPAVIEADAGERQRGKRRLPARNGRSISD